jgi:hypothetical protein
VYTHPLFLWYFGVYFSVKTYFKRTFCQQRVFRSSLFIGFLQNCEVLILSKQTDDCVSRKMNPNYTTGQVKKMSNPLFYSRITIR